MRIGIFSFTFGGMNHLTGHSESFSISDTGTHLWIRALHLLSNMILRGVWSLFRWGPGLGMGKKGRGKGKTHALGQRGADNFVLACLGVLEAVVGDTDPWWGWEKGNFKKILVGGTQ